jgi:hypothetical protein
MAWVAVAVAGATLAGTVLTNQANKKAASTAKEGELEAARLANEGIDKQIGAVKEGIAEGDVLYGGIREQTQPGVNYVRNIIAAPQTLTPAQQAELENVQRSVVNSSQVAGSALRGSGQSFVDAMRNVGNDFRLKALDQNQRRADQAALEFVRPNFTAAGEQAAAHATQGRVVGQALANQGANFGDATREGAYGDANATTANAGNWGQAIGDIASTIAGQQKAESRPAKYSSPAAPDYDPYGLNR